jgi:hypothetical protein
VMLAATERVQCPAVLLLVRAANLNAQCQRVTFAFAICPNVVR